MLTFWPDPDRRIVQQVLCGRYNEFGVLVERYLPAAQAVARGNLINPADTEDVVQESFVSAFQKLNTLAKPQQFGPWLLMIVRNTARSWRRRQSREAALSEIEAVEPISDAPSIEKEEIHRIVHQTLQDMDFDHREILMLHYYAGKSLREISQLSGISREAAAKRLQRARQALGEKLLQVVPEECPSKESLKKRAKLITTVALAAPIAWKAAPAYAATAMMAASAAKWALAAGLVAGTVAATYVAVPKLLESATPRPANAASAPEQKPPAALPSPETATPETAPVTTEENAQEDTVNPVGTNTLATMLVDLQDKPIPDTEVNIELINWGPTEIPPKKTARWTGRSDANGRFVFENLPDGPYCITAMKNGLGGANDALVRPDHGYTPRNVKMYPAMPCGGVLKDEAGKPVPGAVLYPAKHVLFPDEEFDHWTIASVRAETDKEGRFHFKGLIPGGWILFVVAPNRPPIYTNPFEVPTETGEVFFATPGTLKGQVVDATDGQPMPHVKITLAQGDVQILGVEESGDYKNGWRVQRSALSDDSGVFSFDRLLPGEYQVLVDDPMLCLAAPKLAVTIQSEKTTEGFEVRVSTGGQIAGRVSAETGEEGVPGVSIAAYGAASETRKQATTNAAGEYRITGLPPGQYDVRIDKTPEGYLRPGYDERPIQVSLESPQEGIDFSLTPGMRVSGLVLDAEGNAVEGAEVSGRTQNPDSYDYVKSEADGSFALTRLAGNAKLTVSASKDDWKAEELNTDLGTGLADVVLTLDTLAASTIEGAVLNAAGKPLQAEVFGRYTQPGKENEQAFYERTTGDGRFTVENVSAGRYAITATPGNGRMIYHTAFVSEDGAEPKKPLETIVEVRDRENVKDVVVRIESENDLTICGKVVSPDGKPTMFAAVTIVEMQKLASPKLGGLFSFEGLPTGSFTICAAAPNYSPVLAERVAAGTKDLVLKLERTAALRGRVVDASNQSPLDTFEVAYHSTRQLLLEATPGMQGQKTCKEAGGQFVLEGLPTLPLTLKVKAEGYAPWELAMEPLKGGRENPILVELSKGGVIEGFVHDAAGNPLGQVAIGGNVYVVGMAGNAPLAVSNADGSFVLKDQPTGKEQKFVASREGFAPLVFQATAQPGSPVSTDVLMEAAGTLRVRARLNGQPVTEFSVYPQYDEQDKTILSSYAGNGRKVNGEYVRSDLPSGEVTVSVGVKVGETYLNGTKQAVIASGQETLVEVDIDSGACVLEGKLTISGAPAANSFVRLENADKSVTAIKTANVDGYYRFEGLPADPCEITMHFRNPDGSKAAVKKLEVTLEEGTTSRLDFNLEDAGTIQGKVVTPLVNCTQMYILVFRGVLDPQTVAAQMSNRSIEIAGTSPLDGEGQFRLEYLDAGTYTVMLSCAGRIPEGGVTPETRHQAVIVPENGLAEVVF